MGPVPTRSDALESRGDPRGLSSFLRIFAIIIALLGAVYLAIGVGSGSIGLYLGGAMAIATSFVARAAERMANAGRVERAARVISYTLLITAAIAAPLAALAYATLALTCALASTVAIAFGDLRRSRAVIIASLVVAVYSVVLGVWLGQKSTVPEWARGCLIVGTTFAHVFLIGFAMLKARERLTATVRAREMASAKLEKAHHTLEAAYERVQSADRRKDDFLAMLGHELRNPLSPIMLALELMRDECPGVAEQERAIIERQVRHMTRLVDDLLDASRITRGKLELQRQHTDLVPIAREAVEMNRPALARRGQELELRMPRGGLFIHADPTRIAQVLTNLLSNASKYTPDRGHIALDADASDGDARIVVQDDGMGMSKELVARAFEPFVQGAEGTDRRPGGLGLGLTLARTLVEMHDGTIVAESAGVGRGSRFTVRIPLAAPPVGDRTRPSQPHKHPPMQRILVVDDNEDSANLVARALGGRGFDVRVALDGPEALRIASRFEPEIALLDIGLPRMDGYELAARIREEHPDHPPRLIALTGYGQPSDRERSRRAGFSAHLVKPVDLEQLDRCLE